MYIMYMHTFRKCQCTHGTDCGGNGGYRQACVGERAEKPHVLSIVPFVVLASKCLITFLPSDDFCHAESGVVHIEFVHVYACVIPSPNMCLVFIYSFYLVCLRMETTIGHVGDCRAVSSRPSPSPTSTGFCATSPSTPLTGRRLVWCVTQLSTT